MTNYRPVKITFDIDDPYHKALYEYLKKQTNGSSFIRTLLHQSMNNNKVVETQFHNTAENVYHTKQLIDEVVNEQKVIKNEQPKIVDFSAVDTPLNKAAHSGIRINVNNKPVEEDDIFIDDLI